MSIPETAARSAGRLVIPSRILACFCLALALPGLAPIPAIADDSPFVGHWAGAIETPGKALEFDIDLNHTDGGPLHGDISIPAQGAKDLPLAKLAVSGREIRFELGGVPGTPAFVGKLEPAGRKIEGTFTQGGAKLAFRMEKGPDPVTTATASLAGFDTFLGEAINGWEVPGLAIAIVKDGQTIFARGFGYRDVTNKLPVTSKTLFAIGSCSKAFTTFVMGTLVDEGRLDWDTPTRTYIPEFRMFDRVATEQLTLRDLVTHRSGLPRHDALWYNADLTRKQIVDRLPYLEPSEPLRAKFQYNNLMYMTAGYLIERVTGRSWEDAVRARVFEPLGMGGANFSVKDSQKAHDFAKPYDNRDDKVVEIPFRDITSAGPAGSINASVEDMARWVKVHTHKGRYEGRTILSPAVLEDIHAPHMTMDASQERKEIAPAGYALGWFVEDYRGHRRVGHGGNIDGFSAVTALFPQDGLGIVVLANMNGTGLPERVVRHAADRVLGLAPIDWNGEGLSRRTKGKAAAKEAKAKKESVRRPGTMPAHKLEEYAGTYDHPGYGTLLVEFRDGKLHARYNNIEAPLEHWHFEVFRALKNEKDPVLEDQKLQFITNLKGFVESVAIGLEPRIKPIVLTKRPDARLSDPKYLGRFAGDYELAGRTLSVRVKGNLLVVDSAGQGAISLSADRDDEFNVKEQAELSIRFVSDKDGKVIAMALNTPSGVFTAPRKTKSGP